jgi:riboflavin kinase, archaea type
MKIKLSGRVFTGQGEGRKYVERPWVRSQIQEKLGFTPYAGTLNLRLSAESEQQRRELEKSAFLRVCAAEGCCSGLLFKASIAALECAVVIPEVEGYPKDVLEVVAWTNLRERLRLQDGDEVTVTVNL